MDMQVYSEVLKSLDRSRQLLVLCKKAFMRMFGKFIPFYKYYIYKDELLRILYMLAKFVT